MISIDSVKCVDDILAKAIDMVEQNISCYLLLPNHNDWKMLIKLSHYCLI
jgi:hypothetical protein